MDYKSIITRSKSVFIDTAPREFTMATNEFEFRKIGFPYDAGYITDQEGVCHE